MTDLLEKVNQPLPLQAAGAASFGRSPQPICGNAMLAHGNAWLSL
jgi:hypothetical protein